jgi:hypothetical protein
MDISSFLNRLKSLKFDLNVLKEQGFEDEDIVSMLNVFTPKRNGFQSVSEDALIQFIEEYKTDFGLISNISFNETIERNGNNIFIGWYKGEDPLSISINTNEIIVVSHWDYNAVNFYCALNSKKFMEAFLIHGIGRLDINFGTQEDKWNYNLAKANEAAIAAGGEKYLMFWQSLYPVGSYRADNQNASGLLN